MRYTENRNGVIVVPKRFHDAAIEKLAKYENLEEQALNDDTLRKIRITSDCLRDTNPEITNVLILAANRINVLTFVADARAKLIEIATEKGIQIREETLAFLDEIDGQLIDDPVSVIREKIEEVLG